MEIEVSSKFGVLDYCLFAATILISLLIGIYTAMKGNKSPEEFLMGNRSFGPVPIAMSLLTSFVSAISLLGISGEAYAHGTQLSLFIVGIFLGITVAGVVVLPVIYPLKLTSVNEYIELRFKSSRLLACISFLTCSQGLLYMGVCLYAPTVALVSVTNLGYLTYIFLLGIICTVYSSFGGIRAVIWTDVFQLSVMMIGLIVINIIGCHRVGGLIETWSIASSGGRLDLYNMNPSLYERHNFYNTIGLGVSYYAALYGVSQINVQRMCSVRSYADAHKVLLLNIFGMVFIYFLIFTGGLIVYATYAGCDPLTLGLIEKKDQILPYFVIDRLGFIPGLPGMFVATILGGTMSSLSSVINGTVAMVWKDVCLKFAVFKNSTIQTATLANKAISLLVGCLLIGVAIICSQSEGLIEMSITITGVLIGPVFGVFLIGLLFPKCNIIGVWAGLITSLAFVNWISIGALFTRKNSKMLPMSTENCDDFKMMVGNWTIDSFTNVQNATELVEGPPVDDEYDFPLAKLYGISYTLYCIIGPILCVIIAVIVSFLTGNQSKSEVSPKYITPFLRKIYWSEEELESIQMKEQRTMSYNVKESSNEENDFEVFVENESKENFS